MTCEYLWVRGEHAQFPGFIFVEALALDIGNIKWLKRSASTATLSYLVALLPQNSRQPLNIFTDLKIFAPTFFRRISTFFRFSTIFRHFPQRQQLQKGTTHNAFVTCRAPSAARSAAPPRVRSTAAPCRRGCRPAPSGMRPGSEPSSKPWNGDRRPGRAMGQSMGINMEFIWILYLIYIYVYDG